MKRKPSDEGRRDHQLGKPVDCGAGKRDVRGSGTHEVGRAADARVRPRNGIGGGSGISPPPRGQRIAACVTCCGGRQFGLSASLAVILSLFQYCAHHVLDRAFGGGAARPCRAAIDGTQAPPWRRRRSPSTDCLAQVVELVQLHLQCATGMEPLFRLNSSWNSGDMIAPARSCWALIVGLVLQLEHGEAVDVEGEGLGVPGRPAHSDVLARRLAGGDEFALGPVAHQLHAGFAA